MEMYETNDKEWIVDSPFLYGLLGTEQIEAFLPPVEDKTEFVLWSSGVKLSDPDDATVSLPCQGQKRFDLINVNISGIS